MEPLLRQAPVAAARPSPGLPPRLEEIYKAEAGFLWLLLRRLGVAEPEIEDALHDTFVVVHRRLCDFEQDRPVRPWLAGIARRVASDYRRRAPARREVAVDPEMLSHLGLASEQIGADEVACRRQAEAALLKVLATLPEERREVFVLAVLEGLPIPSLVDALGAPMNTLYSRLRLAKRDIMAALSEHAAGGSHE